MKQAIGPNMEYPEYLSKTYFVTQVLIAFVYTLLHTRQFIVIIITTCILSLQAQNLSFPQIVSSTIDS